MNSITTSGTLDGFQPVTLHGIVNETGECVAVRVIDGFDGKPISWAMSEKMLSGFRRIIEAARAAA